MDQQAQFDFGAHLLGDIHAEAEHVGFSVRFDVNQLVAEGDDVVLAVARDQLQSALRLAGVGNPL